MDLGFHLCYLLTMANGVIKVRTGRLPVVTSCSRYREHGAASGDESKEVGCAADLQASIVGQLLESTGRRPFAILFTLEGGSVNPNRRPGRAAYQNETEECHYRAFTAPCGTFSAQRAPSFVTRALGSTSALYS